jgi:hypothetical protein
MNMCLKHPNVDLDPGSCAACALEMELEKFKEVLFQLARSRDEMTALVTRGEKALPWIDCGWSVKDWVRIKLEELGVPYLPPAACTACGLFSLAPRRLERKHEEQEAPPQAAP